MLSTTLATLLLFFQSGAEIPASLLRAEPAPQSVVAKVDGSEIRASDITKYLWDWRAKEVIEDVINFRMVKAAADRMGIKVDAAAIDKELADQIERIRATLQPGQDLDASLQEQGFPRSRLYLRLHAELLLDQIVLRSFDPNKYVEVSTLIFRPKSEATADLLDAIQRAEKAYQSLKNGAKWEDILKETTSDQAAISAKGRLGWRMLTAFPTPVRDEFGILKEGEVAKPAQTVNGIQIFKLDNRGAGAKGDVLTSLKDQYRTDNRQTVLDQLRKDSKIERIYR